MNTFGNLPQEKAMQTLIHDTNRELSNLKHFIKEFEKFDNENCKILQEAGLKVSSTPFVIVEYMKSTRENLRTALDEYITKFQNDFKEP